MLPPTLENDDIPRAVRALAPKPQPPRLLHPKGLPLNRRRRSSQ